MRRFIPALLSALLVAPQALAAQYSTQAPVVTPGERVRVSYPGENNRVGTVISVADDTLAVQWANSSDTARMARERITRLGVSRGMGESNRGARAKIGFAVGGGLGLLIGTVGASPNPECGGSSSCNEFINGFASIIGASLLGGVGALVGAISGGASERWVDVGSSAPRVEVMVPVHRHGTSLGVALAF